MTDEKNPVDLRLFCEDVFLSAHGRDFLRRSVYDECHFREDFLSRAGWLSIYAENGGELDTEYEFIAEYLRSEEIKNLYITSSREIIDIDQQVMRAVRISTINAQVMQEVQSGFWFFTEPAEYSHGRASVLKKTSQDDYQIMKEVAFGCSFMFTDPLKFFILREHDGYGWTSISGHLDFMEGLKKQSLQRLNGWKEGYLSLEILGGADPSAGKKGR